MFWTKGFQHDVNEELTVLGEFRAVNDPVRINLGEIWDGVDDVNSFMRGVCETKTKDAKSGKFAFFPHRKWRFDGDKIRPQDYYTFTMYVIDTANQTCVGIDESPPFHIIPVWTLQREKDSVQRSKLKRMRSEMTVESNVGAASKLVVKKPVKILPSTQAAFYTAPPVLAATQGPPPAMTMHAMPAVPPPVMFYPHGMGQKRTPNLTSTFHQGMGSWPPSLAANPSVVQQPSGTMGAQMYTDPSMYFPSAYPPMASANAGYFPYPQNPSLSQGGWYYPPWLSQAPGIGGGGTPSKMMAVPSTSTLHLSGASGAIGASGTSGAIGASGLSSGGGPSLNENWIDKRPKSQRDGD